jgi:hypothetical protein
MITPTQAQPQIFIPAPTDGDPPTNRCKKCKVPLPDATWKNCDSCRKNRTESYRRWKKSTEGRTRMKVFNASGPALPLEAQSSSAPAPRAGFTDVAPNKARHSMSSQVSRPFASHPLPLPSERNHNGLPTGPRPPPAPLDQLRSTSSSATPTNTVHIPEFQWSDELVGSLSELPPRSAFLGKFTVVADPAVGNANRAYMFADQLRARGILISYARQSPFAYISPLFFCRFSRCN